MVNVKSYTLKKVKTRFGEMTIPLLNYSGVFSTNFIFDVASSLHPLADGISVLATYNNISPFSAGVVYKGRLDTYTVYTAPFASLGVNNTAVFVRSSSSEINQHITWGNTGENGQAAVPCMIGIDNNNQMLPIPTDINISALSSYISSTSTSFGFAASQTYNPNYAGRQRPTQRIIDLWTDFFNVFLTDESVDPYSPGGETEPGGGEGDHDDTEDDVDFPSSPTLNALSAKFISLYTPTTQQLDDLASFMWSGPFDPDTFKKIFGDPMQAVLGLSIVPVAVPTPVGPPPALTLGNVNTGVGVNQASAQYIEVDCGSLSVDEYWGSYLDYEPYTRTEIYLPYIGVRNISTDDIMGKTIAIKYKVDILSGACVALIKCDNTILYTFNGACAISIPITGNDWTNVINGSISAAISSIGLIAGIASGAAPLTAASAVSALSSASQNVMQMKPYVAKSGAISGGAGFLAVQYPYLIITRPRQALPENQNHYTGYPSFMTSVLGDLTGMTYIDHVHLENIPCTSLEQAEIESLLKGGVIL